MFSNDTLAIKVREPLSREDIIATFGHQLAELADQELDRAIGGSNFAEPKSAVKSVDPFAYHVRGNPFGDHVYEKIGTYWITDNQVVSVVWVQKCSGCGMRRTLVELDILRDEMPRASYY